VSRDGFAARVHLANAVSGKDQEQEAKRRAREAQEAALRRRREVCKTLLRVLRRSA
jgi:hypothetical protein